MVSIKDVLNSNESLKNAGSGLTAVFVGATQGIGLGALRALTKHTTSPIIYVVGRSASRLEILISELKQTNDSATFIPIVINDLTLLRDAEQAASEIAQTASKIDLLIMSQGYISLTREESPEGLDRVQSIMYYSRMRILVSLAPLLRAAPSPRVVSVLSAGQEGQLWADDLGLKQHLSLTQAPPALSSMTTLFLEEFKNQPGNEKVVCVHLYPGWVGTDLKVTGLGPVLKFILDYLVKPLGMLLGYSIEEAGERAVFAATSGRFRRLENGKKAEGSLLAKGSDGEVGSGCYLVRANSIIAKENKVLKKMQAQGMGKKLYDYTMEEFERIARA